MSANYPTPTITVQTNAYEQRHGKAPSGQGFWMFDIDGDERGWYGTFAFAKAEAIKLARRGGCGCNTIKLLPESG